MVGDLFSWIKKWAFRIFIFVLVIATAAAIGPSWPHVVHDIFHNTIGTIFTLFTGHSHIHIPKIKG